jgi:hypothetical protein
MLTSEKIDKIVPAFLQAQRAIEDARLDSKNPHFKSDYASLESVLMAIKPKLNASGLLVSQPIQIDMNGNPVVETYLYHESGQWMSSISPVIFEKKTAQAMGSGYTYARRYALLAMFSIGSSDDDGNAASEPDSSKQENPKQADGAKVATKNAANRFKNPDDPAMFVVRFGADKGKTLGAMGAQAVSQKMKYIKNSTNDFKDSAMGKEFLKFAEMYLKSNPMDELDQALSSGQTNHEPPVDTADWPTWEDER